MTNDSMIYPDLIWHCKYFSAAGKRPNSSGYMQNTSQGYFPGASTVTFVPLIIDLKPTDENCLYSLLFFIKEQAKTLNIVTPCITFDQPLWVKAVKIIESKSMNIVCRLGGFHFLMSFLGSIGKFMENAGLSTVLETIYGENTVKQMLSGKAISRSIRGHFIVESALITFLLSALFPIDTEILLHLQ